MTGATGEGRTSDDTQDVSGGAGPDGVVGAVGAIGAADGVVGPTGSGVAAAKVLRRRSERVFEVDFGHATALVEVFDDQLGVYVPQAPGAPPSPVEGAEHFGALHRTDDGTVTRSGTTLGVVDGALQVIPVIDDAGFELAERTLEVWDAHRDTPAWFVSARRSALAAALDDALSARDTAAAALEHAKATHGECAARVAELRAAIVDLDGAAPAAD